METKQELERLRKRLREEEEGKKKIFKLNSGSMMTNHFAIVTARIIFLTSSEC